MEPYELQDELRLILARLEERQLRELGLAEQMRHSQDPSGLLKDASEERLIREKKMMIRANEKSRKQYSQKVSRGR